MNAPAPHIRRNRDADRAEAERLIAALRVQAASINEVIEEGGFEINLEALPPIATDLAFAADLLGAYATGLALATPDPITSAYLVESYTPAEAMPEIEETVLVWTDEDDDPWLGWFDGLTWWFVDAMPISRVKAWARRPGVAL